MGASLCDKYLGLSVQPQEPFQPKGASPPWHHSNDQIIMFAHRFSVHAIMHAVSGTSFSARGTANILVHP